MLVNIDAGHGSYTNGKRTPYDGYREHWFNVDVAVKLAEAFDRCGIKYTKTGWDDSNSRDDVDVSLTQRQQAIKKAGCDYSISIHYNAFGDGKTYNNASGLDVFISDKNDCVGDSLAMAKAVHAELVKGTKQNDRGVKRKALSMVNCKLMGTKSAILCELGFMTNEFEAKLMQNPDFILECAEEICRGFCCYVNIIYVEKDKVSLSVSESVAEVSTESYHLVKKGETLSKIAKFYNLKWTDIAKKNNIKFPYIIKVGQKLKL